MSLYFEVVGASRALLSVSAILDKGWRVNFDPDRPMIIREAMELHLERRGGLYLFEGEVREVCDEQLGNDEVCDVIPIENEQALDTGPVAEHLHEDVREQIPKAQPAQPGWSYSWMKNQWRLNAEFKPVWERCGRAPFWKKVHPCRCLHGPFPCTKMAPRYYNFLCRRCSIRTDGEYQCHCYCSGCRVLPVWDPEVNWHI